MPNLVVFEALKDSFPSIHVDINSLMKKITEAYKMLELNINSRNVLEVLVLSL